MTPENVDVYLAEAKDRISSTTVYVSISSLRRAARYMVPGLDLTWLAEIAKDLALVAQPRSKFDRVVLPERLIEAGLTLIQEAEHSQTMTKLARATQVRNGLMVALLAFRPIRRKNFAALDFDLIISYLYDPDRIFESNLHRCGAENLICGPAKIVENADHAARQLARPDRGAGNQGCRSCGREFFPQRKIGICAQVSRKPGATDCGHSSGKRQPGKELADWKTGSRCFQEALSSRLMENVLHLS